jgi:hypothetical protein
MKIRLFDSTVLILIVIALVSTLGEPVNPWPTDGWYQTRYALFGSFPGQDNYTPIAAPAMLYELAHLIAVQAGLRLAGEFYVASVLQNLLMLLSACMIYYTLRLMRLTQFAAPVTVGFLLFLLSTGLPQAFWSENITLFLMAAVILSVALILYRHNATPMSFWTVTIACGLCVGLLAITRVTPFVLIPGIALLFFRRMPVRRVVQFTATLTVISLLMLTSMVLQNHTRFGRYELTNSSGRHLWQGVRDFSDRALADSSDYQALKRMNPDIQGKNWWEVPPIPPYIPVQGYVRADQRESLLGKLSKQAIFNAPGLYLMQGARKFSRSIGSAPYRLGFDTFGVWNPLDTKEFLPALSTSMGVTPTFSQTVDAAFGGILVAMTWLYPVSIFALALSVVAKLLECSDAMRSRGRDPTVPRNGSVPFAVFLIVGIPLAILPVASNGLKMLALAGSALCFAILAVFAAILRRKLRRQSAVAQSREHIPFFFFMVLMFFGTLWFSWQIEAADTRNTLPWLPFWAVMLAIAGAYWLEMWRSSRS